MPKRTLDTAAATAGPNTDSKDHPGSPVKIQKTERSHEENQERAYIAASRRADRSLEARVQSAKMASEIHRRRTGRGLKVSEDIVLKEEMYEEEEDDIPRPYRFLTQNLQTNSSDMNHRVNAYLTTQAAMATMARYQEINRLFSESFPSAGMMQQQLNNSIYSSVAAPSSSNASNNHPMSPVSHGSPATTERNLSIGDASTFSHNRRASNVTAMSSPPVLSPASDTAPLPFNSNMSMGPPAPLPASQKAPKQEKPAPAQPSPVQSKSAFTSELPNEAKTMAQVDSSDYMAPYFFGSSADFSYDWMGNSAQSVSSVQSVKTTGTPLETPVSDDLVTPNSHDGLFDYKQDESQKPTDIDPSLFFNDNLEELFGGQGGVSGAAADNWESFVDFGSEQ